MALNLGPMLPGNIPNYSSAFSTTTSTPVQNFSYSPGSPLFSSPSSTSASPNFGEQLSAAITPGLKKLGYGLGYRLTSGGQSPPVDAMGEEPQQADSRSEMANAFLDRMIEEIISGKKTKSNGSDNSASSAVEGMRAFGDNSMADTMEVRYGPGRSVDFGAVTGF